MNDDSQPLEQQPVTSAAEETTQAVRAEIPPWESKPPEPTADQEPINPEDHLKKARGGFQRRIDELVREREYERAEKQKLLDVLARQSQPAPRQPVEQKPDGAPNLDDFDDYGKYLSALARYEARQEHAALRKAEQETATKAEQERLVAEQHRRLSEKQTRLRMMVEAAEKKYPDFYDKVFNQSPDIVPITSTIGEAILESDIGQDVAYYLGTHPTEAQRLAKLSPTAALREFGKLEASLGKQQSAAPSPINPLAGRSTSDLKIGPKEDFESFLKKRNKQLGR